LVSCLILLSQYTSSPPFSLDRPRDPRDLHSFPTRRSSDLLDSELVGLGSAGPSHLRVQGQTTLSGAIDVKSSKNAGVALLDLTSDRKSTRLNSSHVSISYAVFCLKKKKQKKKPEAYTQNAV